MWIQQVAQQEQHYSSMEMLIKYLYSCSSFSLHAELRLKSHAVEQQY